MRGGNVQQSTLPVVASVFDGATQKNLGEYEKERDACQAILHYFIDYGCCRCSHATIKNNLEFYATTASIITARYDKERIKTDMTFICNRQMLAVFLEEYGGVTYKNKDWGFVITDVEG